MVHQGLTRIIVSSQLQVSNQDLPQQVQAWQSQSSFSGCETIEWPFLKAVRDGGDPGESTAAASDNESTQPSSTRPPYNNGAIKKSNYFEREASQIDAKIDKEEEESYGGEGYFFAGTATRRSHSKVTNNNFRINFWTFSETSWCSDQNFSGLDVKNDAR